MKWLWIAVFPIAFYAGYEITDSGALSILHEIGHAIFGILTGIRPMYIANDYIRVGNRANELFIIGGSLGYMLIMLAAGYPLANNWFGLTGFSIGASVAEFIFFWGSTDFYDIFREIGTPLLVYVFGVVGPLLILLATVIYFVRFLREQRYGENTAKVKTRARNKTSRYKRA